MIEKTCPRCSSRFYTAVPRPHISCPFCGFPFKADELMRRQENRATIQRNCDLSKGDRSFSAQTVDISRKGLGLEVPGELDLSAEDTLHVKIKDFEIDSDAQVVWVRKFENAMSKVGLRFCAAAA